MLPNYDDIRSPSGRAAAESLFAHRAAIAEYLRESGVAGMVITEPPEHIDTTSPLTLFVELPNHALISEVQAGELTAGIWRIAAVQVDVLPKEGLSANRRADYQNVFSIDTSRGIDTPGSSVLDR